MRRRPRSPSESITVAQNTRDPPAILYVKGTPREQTPHRHSRRNNIHHETPTTQIGHHYIQIKVFCQNDASWRNDAFCISLTTRQKYMCMNVGEWKCIAQSVACAGTQHTFACILHANIHFRTQRCHAK